METTDNPQKAHHQSRNKKKEKNKNKKNVSFKDQSEKQRRLNNPKAFIASSSGKASADKSTRRNAEKAQSKLHVPLQDASANLSEPAPYVVAVMGPPGSGKTTLIKSMVKRYTKQNMNQALGPITLVSGKKRRLTFVECRNDLNSLIDVSKIADICLLMVNGSKGFEMETFEFLNLMQVHGFPKVMGVMTHLDGFKDAKKLKEVKKQMKQRFWTELHQGAKLFYLSGLHNRRLYLPKEILNLSRFISVAKIRPLIWHNTHPYVIADRVEDLTPMEQLEENDKVDRKIAFYGYNRGIPLRPGVHKLHIPGVGDFELNNVEVLPDPCPFPSTSSSGRTKLNDKQRLVYAPMSDLSGIRYDQDAVYIDMPTRSSSKKADQGESDVDEGSKMLEDLKEKGRVAEAVEDQLQKSDFFLFKDTTVRVPSDGDQSLEEDEDDFDEESESNDVQSKSLSADETDSDAEDFRLVDQDKEEDEDDFYRTENLSSDEELIEKLKLQNDADEESSCSEGGFEDLEAEDQESESDGEEDQVDFDKVDMEALLKEKEDLKKRFEREYEEGKEEDMGKEDLDTAATAEDADNYFEAMKRSFHEQQMATEAALKDLDPSAKAKVAGYNPGTYVKIVLEKVPCELMTCFDPSRLIILGGLHAHEYASFGYCQARLKKHRWFPKILKTNDPLVISLGWRRFQTLPIFSLKDATRDRMLKYTPEHMHCLASFWGPITPQNSGFCAFKSVKDDQRGWRVAATGTILQFDQTVNIVKKLKLVGYPHEIHKNTVFVKEMFTSPLEVSKFQGAALRTVSGIRGQVKKAQGDKGIFRASFEDKLLMSDIVFLRTWYPVIPKQYCNQVTSLLERDGEWKGMRVGGELRQALGVELERKKDSEYREITERPEKRRFNPLRVPASVMKKMPFGSRQSVEKHAGKPRYVDTRKTVMLEQEEKARVSLLQQAATIQRDKREKRVQKQRDQRHRHALKVKQDEARREQGIKRKIVEKVVQRERKKMRSEREH